jgi:N-acetylmuramic acid 6-phosphate etherase
VVSRPELDVLPSERVIRLLLDGQGRAVGAVRDAVPALTAAVALLRTAIAAGGRLAFAGAGTSGRLAAAEAAELPGTFGIDPARCVPVIAGADPAVIDDSAEDDAADGVSRVRAAGLGAGDVLIAVAASGSTPFTLAAARAAREAGAAVIAVVNAAPTPLAEVATVAIEAVTGEEVLRGSSRLAAGTAQKIVLNTLTTAAMAAAGRVHGDLMVDVAPANAKLRGRAAGIVADIAGCSPADAAAALSACDGDARAAVLHLVRGLPPEAARTAAAAHPSLRTALAAVSVGGR